MKPVSYSSNSAWSKVFMPRRVERDMTSLIFATSPLKIRSWISGDASMISIAALVREEIDDAVERLVGAVGVQRREHQVAGLGELDAVLHGVAVADLTDQDDIRRLAQGVLEGVGPRLGVYAHLTVSDDAALVGVHVLDRVLDGDDVAAGLLVAVADHRRERG